MKVVFASAAQADLAAIEDFIAIENPGRAATFTDELIAACEAICELPFGYPIVPRYDRKGFRRKVHRQYLIFYRLQDDGIQIVRVVHGARDVVRLLGGVGA